MRAILHGLFLLMLGWMLLSACSGDPGSGPVEVKWDRDVCTRCRMVLSDRTHSAQVRGAPAGEKTKAYKFDDIGCAVLWLEQQPWKDEPRTEVWVNDHRTGEWIDARRASYLVGHTTPMEYGLGAQLDALSAGLNFEQATAHIHEVEARFNVHGSHLEQTARERETQH